MRVGGKGYVTAETEQVPQSGPPNPRWGQTAPQMLHLDCFWIFW